MSGAANVDKSFRTEAYVSVSWKYVLSHESIVHPFSFASSIEGVLYLIFCE